MSTEWRFDGLLTLFLFSRVEAEREIGGVLAKTLDTRGFAGVSLACSAFSFLSDVEPLDDVFSSLSAGRFLEDSALSSVLGLDGFFADAAADAAAVPAAIPAAVHAP